MIIRGNTVGTPMPRTNYEQTDPNKADYLKGKDVLDQNIAEAKKAGTDAQTAANNAQTTADNAQTTANAALPKSGSTMTGAINMGSNKITNLATPTNNGDAVNKSYADGLVAARNIKTYTDPTQFGCTTASTLDEVYSKLPNGSIFVSNAGSFSDASWGFPNTSATLLISKSTSPRGIIQLFLAYSPKQYFMHLVSKSGSVSPSGVWTAVMTTIPDMNTKVVKLWENASLTSAFANQKIAVDLSSYQAVIIEMQMATDHTMTTYGILPVSGRGGFITVSEQVKAFRKCNPSATGINFSQGTAISIDGVKTTSDAHAIPCAIYGVR